MKLTQKNLENHGWLFSHSLGVMVREHECGHGKWDIEVEAYKPILRGGKEVPTMTGPVYEADTTTSYPAYGNVGDLLADNTDDIAIATDWVDGDTVHFF